MIYKCTICGHIHNEEATGILLKNLGKCPVCKQDISKFVEMESSETKNTVKTQDSDLSYQKEFAKSAGIGGMGFCDWN